MGRNKNVPHLKFRKIFGFFIFVLNELQNFNSLKSTFKNHQVIFCSKIGIWFWNFVNYFTLWIFLCFLSVWIPGPDDLLSVDCRPNLAFYSVEPSPPLKPGASNYQTFAWTRGLLPRSGQYEDQHVAKI